MRYHKSTDGVGGTEPPNKKEPLTRSLQARPTEYEGIRFRSKSEAIFARCLSLCNWFWEYEPDNWRVGYGTLRGWTPDFWAVRQLPGCHQLRSLIIEYKPSKPTDTYIEELSKRFDSLWPQTHGHNLILCYGSPFDGEILGLEWLKGIGEWAIVPWFNPSIIKEALNFRFDLVP